MPQLFEKPRILQVKYWLADKCNISGHKLPPPLQFSRKYFTSSLLHHVHLRWCQSPPSWRPMASGNLVAGTCLHWGSMPVTRYFKILQYSTINTPGDLHIWSFWKDIKVSNSVKVWQGLYPLAPHPTLSTLHYITEARWSNWFWVQVVDLSVTHKMVSPLYRLAHLSADYWNTNQCIQTVMKSSWRRDKNFNFLIFSRYRKF